MAAGLNAVNDFNPISAAFDAGYQIGSGHVASGALAAGIALIPGDAGGEIKVGEKALAHVLERHGAESLAENASKFLAGEDIQGLIKGAESVSPSAARAGRLEFRVDAGRIIGTDRETGPTSIYTVITTDLRELITAHPGTPGGE